MADVFWRWGALVQRFRWLVLVGWLIALIPAAWAASGVASRLSSGGYEIAGSDSAMADEVLAREFGLSPNDLTLVLRAPAAMSPQDFGIKARQAYAALAAHPAVAEAVETPTDAASRSSLRIATIRLAVSPDEAIQHIPSLRKSLRETGLETWLTGGPAIDADMSAASERDVQRAEVYALPAALVILVLVFGSLASALLPLMVAAAGIAVTLAALTAIASATAVSVFVLNIATLLGLGLGIDYALLMTYRYRDELGRRPPAEALAVTMATAGKAVLFSGVMVAIGFSAMTIVGLPVLKSIGMGGALVVVATVLASLTLLPALLAVFGHRLEWLSVLPPKYRLGGAGWARFARFTMRYPIPVVLATVAVLALAASPAPGMRLESPGVSALPSAAESRAGAEIIAAAFPQMATPAVVVTLTDPSGVLRPTNAGFLAGLGSRLAGEPGIAITAAPPYAATASSTFFAAASELPATQLGALVRELRDMEVPEGLEVHVGGSAARRADLLDALYGPLPWVLAFVLGLSLIALALAFGSLVLPLNAVGMNLLSLTAAFGAIVFVFQDGRLERLLGFAATGSTDVVLPIVLFCILFGLSMDYQVFMLTRVREAYLASRDPGDSVAVGLQHTGGIITGAASIMIVVASAFVSADVLVVKTTALGIALAVLADATIVRALLLPATMRLLGRWSWTVPAWLRPLLDRTAAGIAHGGLSPMHQES